jgi:hypothetical protein
MTSSISTKPSSIPPSVFHASKDVLTGSGLSIEDKKAILMRWEADAQALLRATDEGTPPADNRNPAELLRPVHLAIEAAVERLLNRFREQRRLATVLSIPERMCALVTELNATEACQATKRPRVQIG